MNVTCSSQVIQQVNAQAGIFQFPVNKFAQKPIVRGWICNLSKRYVFTHQHHDYLQISASNKHSQFALICKLLAANTCRVIYFDEQLTPEQLVELRVLHDNSQTELLHAKLAYTFAKEVSILHA
jgi:hypothetical protein